MATTVGPLAGVRVVDFTHILAGPFCTQLLADAGADVVKVEPPGGEFSRVRGPVRVAPDGSGSMSSYHAAINRGKRSIALDLKNPDGLTLAKRFVGSADVVVENFAPGALKKLGLDLDELRAEDPRLVTVSITLYGNDNASSPLATRGGLAIVAEAESSITAMTRDRDGRPVMLGMPIGDLASGFSAYAGIATALFQRERTGVGVHLDISMVRSLFAFNAVAVTGAQIPDTAGFNRRPAGYGLFRTRDGFVALGVNSDHLFRRLCAAMGTPELADHPGYASYTTRDMHNDEVNEIVENWTSQFESATVIALASDADVPCGKVRLPGEMLDDPELAGMGFVQTVDDGMSGTIETPANPIGHVRADLRIPRLAEHTEELLAEIGVGGGQLAALAERGAFGTVKVGGHA